MMRTIQAICCGLFALASFAIGTTQAQDGAKPEKGAAANSIESVQASSLQGGDILVRISFKQPLTGIPASFSVNAPPRVAIDFPATANATGKTLQEVGERDLRNINIVQVGNRTRLVMNLNKPLTYDAQLDGKTLLVTLRAPESAASAAPTRFAEAKPDGQKHSIRDVDFRRGPNGEGRVVIDLSDAGAGIDLRQQGKNIVVDFIQTSLPRKLERRLDVGDFATPVEAVETFAQGSNVRLVVRPRGLWEHSAYQADNRFILEVKPVVEDPNKLTQGTRGGYTGEKLSLNFQSVEVRAVLQVIADFTGLNIITSDTVTGNLTLRLKDVPWDQAMDIILQSKGLDMRKNGNVVLIAPRDELATKEKLELESRQQIADLEPTRTEAFQLNYQKGADVQKILTDSTQKMLSKRGSAVVDARTNTVFVQDAPSRLEEIRKLIKKIDVPVRQVMIEARIVEASDNFSKTIGARLGYHDMTGQGANLPFNNQRIGIGGQLNDTGFHTGQVGTAPPFEQSLGVNLPAPALSSGASAGAFSLLLFNSARTKFLNLELTALQLDGRGKIVSSPRVVTADQVEAIIEQGTEIPYQQATSSGATSVSFKKATLSLKVKPQITPDDNVIMNLDVHKDSQGANTVAGPAINTKQITTQVLVENGGTVVIGGIYEQTETDTTNKVPLLGDIPVVGFLFKNNIKIDNKTELLVFISPRIIKDTLGLR